MTSSRIRVSRLTSRSALRWVAADLRRQAAAVRDGQLPADSPLAARADGRFARPAGGGGLGGGTSLIPLTRPANSRPAARLTGRGRSGSVSDVTIAMTPAQVRDTALGLPGAVERDHHGFPSFRVRRIFATLPDDQHLRVMLAEEDIRAAVAEWPGWCAELRWGSRLSAVQVTLADCDPAVVAELLQDAWRLHS